MHDAGTPPARLSFFGLLADELDNAVQTAGWPKFRAQQLRDWIYHKGVVSFSGMSNLSQLDQQRMGQLFVTTRAEITAHQSSEDGTQKLLLTWPDGTNAETVMIPDADRRTACVSSQVGCPVGCRFCASGVGGVKGNLSADQIVEQVVQLNLLLHKAGERVTNVVFMGMGEPLANYAAVMKAVRVLHDPKGLNISARKITISTVGVPARMRQLAGEELPLNLAISLHAPEEGLRKNLIPWAEHFSLDEILDAARYYFDQTGREITLEYILLSGVNDRPQHARKLAMLCKTLRANVNLIRYNEVEALPFKRPESVDVTGFQEVLRANGVNVHVRKSRGRDIDAACGQLRKKREDEQLATLKITKGFTLVELLVGAGVMGILLVIFIPYLTKIREDDRRVRCAANMNEIWNAMKHYADSNNHDLPRVRYDAEHRPDGFTAFTGADATDPFVTGTTVQPNDVTASLWLLVRNGLSPRKFICPSSDESRDTLLDVSGVLVAPHGRANFRSGENLSYSYATPFGSAPYYRLNTDLLEAKFVILADKNPGISPTSDVTVPLLSPVEVLARANSHNHQQAGQNVLYAYGEVVFVDNPYVGIEDDNIYTVQVPYVPSLGATTLPATARLIGSDVGPASNKDSYLVPSDAE